jgi:DNA-packaging protein gp3
MQVGRPRTIESPEEMLRLGNAYFEECRINDSHILITGLAMALGLSGREALSEYGRREEYSVTVKSLKSVCEQYAENKLFGNNPTGPIFALKNYGWTDRTQQELSGPDGGPIQTQEVTVKFVKTGESQ